MEQKQQIIVYIIIGIVVLFGAVYAYISAERSGCDLRGTNFENDITLAQLIRNVEEESGGKKLNCVIDEDSYAFFVALPGSKSYVCIDSTGFSGEIQKPVSTSNCLGN
tara:strand:- start:1727 stop:2050 length:324 start_codon:yes stop_codon:yes gene_type:complete